MVGLELLQCGESAVTRLLGLEPLALAGIELVESVGRRGRLTKEWKRDHDDERDGQRRAEREPDAHVAGRSAGSPARA